VVVDGPVFLAGKFHGFRIGALKGKDWQGVDLKAGDVVTRVNGFTVERPENAFEAFQSLEVASELRVDFERDGEPRSLRYAIVDD
jgi:type II secretory pathway component PulC